MNLTHFDTPKITYKDKKWYPIGKLFKIASFSLSEDGFPTGINTLFKMEAQIATILQTEDMKWIVSESYGGLYYRSTQIQQLSRFDLITEVELYVYVPHEIFTFCQLKFSDNLTKMK